MVEQFRKPDRAEVSSMKLPKWHLIVLVIYFSKFVYCEIQNMSEPEHPDLIFLDNIMTKFLENQESVTFFDIDQSITLKIHTIMILKILQSILPVKVYGGLNKALAENIHDMGNELSIPSTTKSYFVISMSTDLFFDKLRLFSQVNTNGRWFFVLVNVEQTQVKSLLTSAWTAHKMANILVLYLDKQYKMFIESYNPFKIKDKQRGTFWNSVVNYQNIPAILKMVENIFETKVRDLQHYKLKAAYFSDISYLNSILDKQMMEVFEKTLNTKFTFVGPRDGRYLGTRQPNGSITGIES